MAAGNTFGATALSSYGGFWIAMGITFTPGGFNIMGALEESGGGSPAMFYDSLGLFLMVQSPPVQSPLASAHNKLIRKNNRAGSFSHSS